jgi:hypothetical protein
MKRSEGLKMRFVFRLPDGKRRVCGIGPLKKTALSKALRRSQQCISPTSRAPWRHAWARWTGRRNKDMDMWKLAPCDLSLIAGRGTPIDGGVHRSSHRPGCICEAGARGCPEAEWRISLGASRPYPAQLQPTILCRLRVPVRACQSLGLLPSPFLLTFAPSPHPSFGD